MNRLETTLPHYKLDAISADTLLLRVFSEELKGKLPYQSLVGAPLTLQLSICVLDTKYVAMYAGKRFLIQPDFALCMPFKEAFRLAFDAFAGRTDLSDLRELSEEDDLQDEHADDDFALRRFY